jgi:hypothetical protein
VRFVVLPFGRVVAPSPHRVAIRFPRRWPSADAHRNATMAVERTAPPPHMDDRTTGTQRAHSLTAAATPAERREGAGEGAAPTRPTASETTATPTRTEITTPNRFEAATEGNGEAQREGGRQEGGRHAHEWAGQSRTGQRELLVRSGGLEAGQRSRLTAARVTRVDQLGRSNSIHFARMQSAMNGGESQTAADGSDQSGGRRRILHQTARSPARRSDQRADSHLCVRCDDQLTWSRPLARLRSSSRLHSQPELQLWQRRRPLAHLPAPRRPAAAALRQLTPKARIRQPITSRPREEAALANCCGSPTAGSDNRRLRLARVAISGGDPAAATRGSAGGRCH